MRDKVRRWQQWLEDRVMDGMDRDTDVMTWFAPLAVVAASAVACLLGARP